MTFIKKTFLLIFCASMIGLFGLGSFAGVRSVESEDEEVRLSGFNQHGQQELQLEKERLSGLGEYKKEKQNWLKSISEAVVSHKEQRSESENRYGETSHAFREYIAEKLQYLETLEAQARRQSQEKMSHRKRTQKSVILSEEDEYGLNDQGVRVLWTKRSFAPGVYSASLQKSSGRPSGSGGRFGSDSSGSGNSGGYGGGYSPPSGGFESDFPPPPPPSMEPPVFDESNIPPPPPIFDEENN